MSDISDLHGVYATPLRWNAEAGILSYGYYDEATGERTSKEIELGSQMACFAMDLATRERGYGMIRVGVCDFRLTPVGSTPPPWPDDDDFKHAIGCFVWNPRLGELRLETNAVIFFNAINALWNYCRTFEEATAGLQPSSSSWAAASGLSRRSARCFTHPSLSCSIGCLATRCRLLRCANRP
jgi:hypothetical protein